MKITVGELFDKIHDIDVIVDHLSKGHAETVAYDAIEIIKEYREVLLNAKVDVNCQP